MHAIDALRSGSWVTRDRARAFAVTMIAVTLGCTGFLIWGAHGTVDVWGRPIGTDFSNVWSAGWMAMHGRAAEAWDWAQHFAVQQRVHGRADIPFYGWHYPPPFLLVAAALASFPYLVALAAWQGMTLAAAAWVAHRIVPERGTVLVALGFPAVFVCLGHGQNGFLTAALLGLGLLLLDGRPWLAGALLGCLVYKPQFAPVLPVLLLAGGHWRALVGAGASAAVLVVLTTAIWGVEVWAAFLASLPLTRTVVIEGVNTGAWKIVSAFAAVRLNGGGVAAAYAVQAAVSAVAIGGVVLARRAPGAVRGAVAIAAALLATPYVFDYDMVALGMAIAFLCRGGFDRGFLPWERTLLAFAYVAPLIGRGVAEATGVPLGLLAILAVWALAMRRAVTPAHEWQQVTTESRLRTSPFRRSRAVSGR